MLGFCVYRITNDVILLIDLRRRKNRRFPKAIEDLSNQHTHPRRSSDIAKSQLYIASFLHISEYIRSDIRINLNYKEKKRLGFIS